jgi:uncharacterized membrane protein
VHTPAASNTASSSQRIAAVDAARGCAMVMVCLSHIKHHFYETWPQLSWWLLSTTRIATPVFLLLSGFVIRYLLRTDPRGNASITLIDRGLFLLLVAHALIGLAELPELGFTQWMFGRALITDAVGFALLFAVLLRNASARTLAVTGGLLCVVSWLLAMLLRPQTEWGRLLGAVLIEIRGAGDLPVTAALVPYLGAFLIGMALSTSLHESLVRRENDIIARRLFRLGAVAVVLVLIGGAVWHFGKTSIAALIGNADIAQVVRLTLDPRSKNPPSPAYFLFYGGAGLVALALLFHGRPAFLVQPTIRVASVIGRASLLCFVLQDWILILIPRLFGFDDLRSVAFWLAWLSLCLVTLYWVARRWEAARGNRFLTIGLKSLARRCRSGAGAVAAGTPLSGTWRQPR